MKLSRRNFLKGFAVTGAAVAAAGMAGCGQPQTKTTDTGIEAGAPAGHPWETRPEPITDIAEIHDYDIVIVGCGVAGMAAAEAAARNGAKTVVIEKAPQASWRGLDVGNVGSRVQREAGVEINPREAARLLFAASQQTANYNLIYTWATRSGAVFDHLQDLAEDQGYKMIQADGSSGTAKFGWERFPDTMKVLQTAVSFVGDDGISTNENLATILQTAAMGEGAEFMFNTKAEQLVGDAASGISGVLVTAQDGSHQQYNAAKGVILATGDFGSNEEMVETFCPIAARSDLNAYTPQGCNTGDGILMGLWAGATLSKSMPAPMIHQFAFDNYNYPFTSFYMSWLNVNRNAERYGADMPFEPYLTNARCNTPGNVAWSLFDADWEQYFQKQMPDSAEMMIEWGKDCMEEFEASDFCIKADTLEELAQKLGVDGTSLQVTVDRYNSMAEAGTDEDFGVPEMLLTQVKTAPFYATPNLCSTLVIPFGLHVNDDSQVLTADDEPISGLFAIGNTQGDFFALAYPVHCPGVSHGRCVTFGQLVGEALAKDTVLTQTA